MSMTTEMAEIRRDVGELKVSMATVVTRLDTVTAAVETASKENGNGNGGIFRSKALNAAVDKVITTILVGGAALVAVKFGITIPGATP